MEAVSEEATHPAQQLVEPPSDTRAEPLDAAGESLAVLGLAHQVHVVTANRVMREPEALAVALGSKHGLDQSSR